MSPHNQIMDANMWLWSKCFQLFKNNVMFYISSINKQPTFLSNYQQKCLVLYSCDNVTLLLRRRQEGYTIATRFCTQVQYSTVGCQHGQEKWISEFNFNSIQLNTEKKGNLLEVNKKLRQDEDQKLVPNNQSFNVTMGAWSCGKIYEHFWLPHSSESKRIHLMLGYFN